MMPPLFTEYMWRTEVNGFTIRVWFKEEPRASLIALLNEALPNGITHGMHVNEVQTSLEETLLNADKVSAVEILYANTKCGKVLYYEW